MKDTSCGSNCPFVKQGFCQSEKECPNYVESWWIEGQESQPKILRDCSPKRMLLQQQLLQSRVESMQSALEQQRNENMKLTSYLAQLIEASKTILIGEKQDEKIPGDDSVKPDKLHLQYFDGSH